MGSHRLGVVEGGLFGRDAAQLGPAGGDVRIVDESGGDYLFLAGTFVPIDPSDQVRSSLLRASSS